MKETILNPFAKQQDVLLLAIGLISMGIGSAIGYYFNARFDGVFDLHFVENAGHFDALSDIVISVFTTTIVFFFIGKSINPKTRFIDIFNAVSIAKIPFYLLAFCNAGNWIYNSTAKLMAGVQKSVLEVPEMSVLIPVLLVGLLSFIGLVVSIMLCFNGCKVATNAKGNKSIGLFVVALVVSEIVSKIIISFL